MSAQHHSHRRPSAHAHNHHAPRSMSRQVRKVVMCGSAALWTSGVIWMALHYFFKTGTEFGVTPNSWEPFTMRIHGALAVLMVFTLGWIGGTHVAVCWRQWRANVDGLILLISGTLLILSGYALYYLIEDSQRHLASLIHQVFGTFVIIIAVSHWKSGSSNKC